MAGVMVIAVVVSFSSVGNAAPSNRTSTRSHEVAALELSGLVVAPAREAYGGPVVFARLGTLVWRFAFVTLLEGGFGVGFGSNTRLVAAHVGTHIGATLSLGAQSRHRLLIGLGVGYGGIASVGKTSALPDDAKAKGFQLAPAFRYNYQTDGNLFVGIGSRVLIPTRINQGHFTTVVLVTLDLGLSWRRGKRRRRKATNEATTE